MSKFEQRIINDIKDPKQTFFKKNKVSNKNIAIIKKAYKEKDLPKNKKSKVLLSRGKKKNNNNTTLLGG